MKTFQQFIEEAANQISPITGKGYLVIPPVKVKDTKGMKRHIVPDFGNPNYKQPQASSSKKNDKVAQGETLKQGNTYLAQLAPPKATNTGVKGDSLNTIILDNPGKRLYRLQQAVKAKGSIS